MKHIKQLLVAFVFLVCAMFAVTLTGGSSLNVDLSGLWDEDATADQTNATGNWRLNHPPSNITDDNYSSYGGTMVNESHAYINFTKPFKSTALSVVQITYNGSYDGTTYPTTYTNYTLDNYGQCWANDVGKVIIRIISNYTQNTSNLVTGENITLLNGTPVGLANDRAASIVVYNITVRTNVVNESGFTWANGTQVYVANTNETDTFKPYNCSTRISIFNETSVNLTWRNGTNMTLSNGSSVDTTSVKIMNCSNENLTEILSGNYTAYDDGNILVTSNTTIIDGTTVCANYTHMGSGYGEFINTNNFTGNYNGSIFMTSNDTIKDGEEFCMNYTYHGAGNGNELLSGNYTTEYLDGNITLSSNEHNSTIFGVNYTYLTDETQSISRHCGNGTDWWSIAATTTTSEIYDVRMFWYTAASTWDLDFWVDPADYTTSTSTDVLHNLSVNLSRAEANYTTVNCSLHTRANNNSAPYAENANATDMVVVNNTYPNATVTYLDGDRIWWYWACEDNQSRNIENSTVRILDIDVDYQVLSVGANQMINFTLNTGNAVTYGTMTAANFTMKNQATPAAATTTCTQGTIVNDDSYIYVCNSTNGWARAAIQGW